MWQNDLIMSFFVQHMVFTGNKSEVTKTQRTNYQVIIIK